MAGAAGKTLLGLLLLLLVAMACGADGTGRPWELIVENAGIASMHAAVTHHSTVVLLERKNIGRSRIGLPPGAPCGVDDTFPGGRIRADCTAHSVMLSRARPASDRWHVRPLTILTDTWCSSGQFVANGTLVQTGGGNEGTDRIRYLDSCPAEEECDWREAQHQSLQRPRWYATNQLLPDGRQIVMGGEARGFTWEYVPKEAGPLGVVDINLLGYPSSGRHNNVYYPFVHLLPNGHLFVLAERSSVEYSYLRRRVVRHYPKIPGEPRTYPWAGSSAMLSLQSSQGYSRAEILVCGGAQYAAFRHPKRRLPASTTCGRLVASEEEAEWEMETMPHSRTMGELVMLPTSHLLLINGARTGCQGFDKASDPALHPLLYSPDHSPGSRFKVQQPTHIARMYHSTANLLPDGRVLVAGSNPHKLYTFRGRYPTQLLVEAFSPHYLSAQHDDERPRILPHTPGLLLLYGTTFTVTVHVPSSSSGEQEKKRVGLLQLNLLSAPFSTHSSSMGQRHLSLQVTSQEEDAAGGDGDYHLTAQAPPNEAIAPPAYYMLFALNQGIPSHAVWVHLST